MRRLIQPIPRKSQVTVLAVENYRFHCFPKPESDAEKRRYSISYFWEHNNIITFQLLHVGNTFHSPTRTSSWQCLVRH